MRAETLARPLSLDSVRDGGTYAVPALAAVRTNVFFRIARVDALYIKVPSREGLEEYRKVVKLGPPPSVDVRHPQDAEAFDQIARAVQERPSFSALEFLGPELLHY